MTSTAVNSAQFWPKAGRGGAPKSIDAMIGLLIGMAVFFAGTALMTNTLLGIGAGQMLQRTLQNAPLGGFIFSCVIIAIMDCFLLFPMVLMLTLPFHRFSDSGQILRDAIVLFEIVANCVLVGFPLVVVCKEAARRVALARKNPSNT